MNIRFFAFAALVLLLASPVSPAQARPEMAVKMQEGQSAPVAGTAQGGPDLTQRASDRFDEMDADQDGKATWAEFSAYFPTMREAAFSMIDASEEGVIDREEWIEFSVGHSGGGMGKAMPAMPGPEGGSKPAPGAVPGTAGGAPGDESAPPQTDRSGGLLLPGIKGAGGNGSGK